LVFIGITSPAKKVEAILDALGTLKEEALRKGTNFLIINTDGWVEGEEALSYKVRLARAAAPDAVVAIQNEDELVSILGELNGVKVFTIDSPKDVKKRDRETRKVLRESAYKKYLKGAKVRSLTSSWVEIDGELKLNNENRPELKSRIEKIIGKEVIHCEETSDCIIFLLRKETRLKEEDTEKLESEFNKKTIGLHEGEEEGVLVALEDAHDKVLGIGTILNIDFENKTIRIHTPIEEAVSKIRVGRIKLDMEGNEIGLILEDL
jgi:polynucleotide 5'-hydroxyl-kinase GRC3/NOL9